MAKKVVKRKKVKKSSSNVVTPREAWFYGNAGDNWGWIPLNWKGWVALAVLLLVNIFAANYFGIDKLVFIQWSKFLVVFLLSLFVFIEIARYKTSGVKV